MTNSPASYALAEELTVIPFPFDGRDREALEEEYAVLLKKGVSIKEISEIILSGLEILLYKREQAKDQKTFDRLTMKISRMLGHLLVFEETFVTTPFKIKKIKK